MMQHRNIVKLSIILLNCLCCLAVGVYDADEGTVSFCYEDPSCGPTSDAWGGQCKTGTQQSPINLPFVFNPLVTPVSLDFNELYYNTEFWIEDNGHTIKAKLSQEPQPKALMSGFELTSPYRLAEIHFHWGKNPWTGSEHSVKMKFYAMEAHLVHFNSKYSNFNEAAASNDSSALAVSGVFLAEGSEMNVNAGFDTIAANIPESRNNETHVKQELNLLTFLPKSGDTFYRYYGSLTTPTCNEIVIWTVVKKPIFVKKSAIQKFRTLKHIGANYRPIQKRGQRSVNYYAKK